MKHVAGQLALANAVHPKRTMPEVCASNLSLEPAEARMDVDDGVAAAPRNDPFRTIAAPALATTPWISHVGPQEAQDTSTVSLGPATILEMDPDYVHQRTPQGTVISALPASYP